MDFSNFTQPTPSAAHILATSATLSILQLAWRNTNIWQIIAATLIVSNLKTIPFMFHFRLILVSIYHTLVRRRHITTAATHGGAALFRPVVTHSRAPLHECDINAHKSSSTYFTDMDISRHHLISHLFKGAADPTVRPPRKTASDGDPVLFGGKQKLRFMLGGTSCTYHKEIKPYAAYEVWSRVTGWDDKWVYIVSHFVVREKRKGAAADAGKVLEKRISKPVPVIYCSAITKYVFKHGRKTVAPTEALDVLGLLPERLPAGETDGKTADALISNESGHWKWNKVEQERQHGMELAKHFAALDGLHSVFEEGPTDIVDTAGSFGDFGGALGFSLL